MLRFLGEDRSLVFDKLFEINVINKSFTAITITNWRKKIGLQKIRNEIIRNFACKSAD